MGLEPVAHLGGGINAWKAAGGVVEGLATGAYAAIHEPSSFVNGDCPIGAWSPSCMRARRSESTDAETGSR